MSLHNHFKIVDPVSVGTVRFAPLAAAGQPCGKILLLQGPVGPFFGDLERHLTEQGYAVTRAYFNAGDRIFGRSGGAHVLVAGGLDAWRRWLKAKLAVGAFDCIILFGAERPAHIVARAVAKDHGVQVIALEEGYIRSGLITIEAEGNNAFSPIAGRLPPSDWVPSAPVEQTVFKDSLPRMVVYGAVYYAMRSVFSRRAQAETFHRNAPLLAEAGAWMRNFGRWAVNCRDERRKISSLIAKSAGRFYLVPLQVAVDSNLGVSALGWNSQRLIERSLRSFAKTAPQDTKLVFKIHPMERGHSNLKPKITALAAALGVAERVLVFETGSLGELTKYSAGMITINSSSGLSAIHHGVPLLVIGRAIYAHPALATCASGYPDFDGFWRDGHCADVAQRRNYLLWLKALALRPGDFYGKRGRAEACQSIAQALEMPLAQSATLGHFMQVLRKAP